MLEISHVDKWVYKQQILKDINFSADQGAVLGILGSNGAGKTTLLRIIAGLIAPDAGAICIAGQRIRYDEKRLRLNIGYMPEDGGLYKRLSVGENLRFSMQFYDRTVNPDERISGFMERFQLSDRRHEKTGNLSGGMRRKVLFLKAVLHQPGVLLLDEPFSGMDVESRGMAIEVIRELKQDGTITCISSHSTGELERICSHYLFIKNGQTVFSGPISEFIKGFSLSGDQSLSDMYLKIMGRA